MAEHTLLLSGYGAPGCDDLAVCRLESDGTLCTLFTARHGRAPSFCCQGENGWIYVASERQDGADITAYVLENGGFREITCLEIPGGQALCHLYPLGNVIYGSCFGNGLFFAVSGDLSRILWEFQPRGANAHWAQAVGRTLFLADLGNHCLYRFPLQNHLPVGDAVVLPQPVGSGPRQVLNTGKKRLPACTSWMTASGCWTVMEKSFLLCRPAGTLTTKIGRAVLASQRMESCLFATVGPIPFPPGRAMESSTAPCRSGSPATGLAICALYRGRRFCWWRASGRERCIAMMLPTCRRCQERRHALTCRVPPAYSC